VAGRYQVDLAGAQALGARLEAQGAFRSRVLEAFGAGFPETAADPDYALYGGGFFCSQDREWMDRICRTPPAAQAGLKPAFRDRRLGELWFRYRARNWPETLSPAESTRWEAHCRSRMEQAPVKGQLDRAGFRAALAQCRARRPDQEALWRELEAYGISGSPCP